MSIVTLIPLFAGTVPAGFPSPAADYQEERIDLNEILIANPSSTFLIRSTGYSMVNAFISPEALLVVDRSVKPVNNDIVVASVNGELMVKYLRKNDYKCFLTPANRKFPELEITPEMDFKVWGVVRFIITDPKKLKNVCTP